MKTRIIFNGKFLAAEPTGVHRVAEELVAAVAQQIAATPALSAALAPELWVPRNAAARAASLGLPVQRIGPFNGIPWEQLTLPWRAGHDLLVNLCNVGPIGDRNAVTMFHDAQVRSAPESYSLSFRLWYRFHQPLAGWRHRKILTVSNFSKAQIVKYGIAKADKIAVVHNGVDHILRYEPDRGVLSRLGLAPHRYVVALANTQPHKNVGLLLRAFERADLSSLTLVLVGGATPEAFRTAGFPIPPNAIFAGRVSDEELRALYAEALAIGFPSTTEGFGLPPMEAMLVGCPAIVAPEGALPEVCGDGALYADAADVDGWVAAIAGLAADPARRALRGEQGARHAAAYTWKRAAGQLLAAILP